MALRLSATGRSAALSGGLRELFDGSGNNLNVVFKTGSVPADVDTVSSNGTIATLAAADEGASNANGSYAAVSDDGTNASIALRSNITGNASAAHNYADGQDGAGMLELFAGTGRTAADKVGDMTVGGSTTTGSQDFNWDTDSIANGGLLTITALGITQA